MDKMLQYVTMRNSLVILDMVFLPCVKESLMNWKTTWRHHGAIIAKFGGCYSPLQVHDSKRRAAGKTAQISSAKGRGCNLRRRRLLGRFFEVSTKMADIYGC